MSTRAVTTGVKWVSKSAVSNWVGEATIDKISGAWRESRGSLVDKLASGLEKNVRLMIGVPDGEIFLLKGTSWSAVVEDSPNSLSF